MLNVTCSKTPVGIPATTPEVVTQSELRDLIGRLDEDASHLAAALGLLTDRLGPVLRPTATSPGKIKEVSQSVTSPLGASLLDHSEAIRSSTLRIAALLETLAV